MGPLRERRRRCLGSQALGRRGDRRVPRIPINTRITCAPQDRVARPDDNAPLHFQCSPSAAAFASFAREATMTNKIDLGGRNAIVTGGAQGIGRAIVERFLDSGATVAIWDRDIDLAKKTAATLQNRGRITPFEVDVTNYSDVERARDETVKAMKRVDILVNNAGIAGPNTKTWE